MVAAEPDYRELWNQLGIALAGKRDDLNSLVDTAHASEAQSLEWLGRAAGLSTALSVMAILVIDPRAVQYRDEGGDAVGHTGVYDPPYPPR
jgi:hypothetical protein